MKNATRGNPSPVLALALALATLAAVTPAQAITTTWTAFTGDWSEPTNWSDGEPTAIDDALIASGIASVSQSGETCASLQLGQGGTSGAVQAIAGSLDVEGALVVGEGDPASIGTFQQVGASVTAQSLDLARGAFSLNNGDFTTETSVMRLGGSFSVILTGEFTNTGALTVEFGSGFTVTGGTLTIGTDPADEALMGGTFNDSATPVMSFQNLAFDGDMAVFHVQLSSFGLATISVAGTLTLDGVLQIIDTEAPDGRYDIATAASVVGDFDLVEFPEGDWTWGVEDNTLFVIKGQQSPVAGATWSQVRRTFAR